MDEQNVTESLKKILMAGFGAVSTGVEKSQEVLDKLAEKGESAYQQTVAAGRETADKLKKAYRESGIRELFDRGIRVRKEDLLNLAGMMSVEDILWLQSQLVSLAVTKGAEAAAETPEAPEAEEAAEEAASPDDAEG